MAPGERIEGDDTSPFDAPEDEKAAGAADVQKRLKEMREKSTKASEQAKERSRKEIEDAFGEKKKDDGTDFEITVDDSPDKAA